MPGDGQGETAQDANDLADGVIDAPEPDVAEITDTTQGTDAAELPDLPPDGVLDADDDAPDWAGYFDDAPDTADTADSVDATPAFECSDRSKLVYVVSAEKVLLSFQPADKVLQVVGTLNCPAPYGDTPFAMGVDRNADAWVLYQSAGGGGGSLYKVSTLDASLPGDGISAWSAGVRAVRHGFVSQSQGLKDETLYIAGSKASQSAWATGRWAKVAFPV